MRKGKYVFYTREWFKEADKPKGFWLCRIDFRTTMSKRRIRREVARMK